MSGLNLPDKIFGTDTRLIVLALEPIVLGLVILFSMILVIVPKINEIPKRMAEIKSVKTKTVEVNEKIKYLQTVDQEKIRVDAIKLNAGLLPEKSAYLLVGVVRKNAADAGYEVDDFSLSMSENKIGQSAKKNIFNFEKLPVLVTLVGPTNNYVNLIKSLERSLPIISIDSLDTVSRPDDTSMVKLTISAYYMPDIGKINYENLKLSDLTPTKEEVVLLSEINEFKEMPVKINTDIGETVYTKYERLDPFFTP
ncbi:MAG: hypothetical protein WC503_05560 [Candidatus Shapirobacteria bacterium]